jgi:hypothetical protein
VVVTSGSSSNIYTSIIMALEYGINYMHIAEPGILNLVDVRFVGEWLVHVHDGLTRKGRNMKLVRSCTLQI